MRESRPVRFATRRQHRAARSQQRADAERWRRELRPRAMRFIASRTTTLTWTRALLRLLLDELQSEDDFFFDIVGPLDRIPPKRFPQAVAIALALRHSWLQSDLTHIAHRLRISLTTKELLRDTSHNTGHQDVDSRARLGRVKALRFAPTPSSGAHGLDTALGRATGQQLRDGRQNPRTDRKRR